MPVVWFTLTRSCQVVKRQAYLVDQAMGKSSLPPLKIDLAFLHLRAYLMVFFLVLIITSFFSLWIEHNSGNTRMRC